MPELDLPADYPFPLDTRYDGDPEIVGTLGGGTTMVYDDTRMYAREGLTATDFDVDPVDEESHINFVLDELCQAVTAVAETMVMPGPWRGMDLRDGDDVCLQTAQLKILVNKLSIPLFQIEEALLKAGINARRRTDYAATAREVRWRDFRDIVEKLAADTTPAFDMDRRRAALTELAGHVQVALGQLDQDVAHDRHRDAIEQRLADEEQADEQPIPMLTSPVVTKDNLHDVAGWARCVLPSTAEVTAIEPNLETVAVSIAVVVDPTNGGTVRAWAGDVLYVQNGQAGVLPGDQAHLHNR